MSKAQRRIEQWLSTVAEPGEHLVSWALLGYAAPVDSLIHRPRTEYVTRAHLPPERQVAAFEAQLYLVLTDRRALVCRRGGLTGNTPKDLLVAAPADRIRLDWFDRPQAVAGIRHIVLHLGDGRWISTSAMVHERSNIDVLVTVLGPRSCRLGG